MGTERSRLGVDLPLKLFPLAPFLAPSMSSHWFPNPSPYGTHGTHLCSISSGLSTREGSLAACSSSRVCSSAFRL